jgi:hypothetical protein
MKPVECLLIIPFHALPVVIQHAEQGLRIRIALFAGSAKPARGFNVILWNAEPGHIEEAEIVLS